MQYEISVSEQMLEGVSYRTYGIRCTEQEIADLTRDAAALKPLLDYCNRLKLSPLHLKDVAEDFVPVCPIPSSYRRENKKNGIPLFIDRLRF